jgi:hypothetical protein
MNPSFILFLILKTNEWVVPLGISMNKSVLLYSEIFLASGSVDSKK